MESRTDPVLIYGSSKLAAKLFDFASLEPSALSFGGARPLGVLTFLYLQSLHALRRVLNFPAAGARPREPSEFWLSFRGYNASQDAEAQERRRFFTFAPRLCIEIAHSAEEAVSLLRNSVESLASAGLLAAASPISLAIRLREGCQGAWSNDEAPEGWYLSWLRQRFRCTTLCGNEVNPCWEEPGLGLLLQSSWHVLPFRPEEVWWTLGEAAALLVGQNSGWRITAVSLMEKTLQGAQGALGAGGRALKAQGRPMHEWNSGDWRDLALTAPAISSSWNLTEAQGKLFDMYCLFAATTNGDMATSWFQPPEDLRHCTSSLPSLCAPQSWWKDWSEDVWLLPTQAWTRTRPPQGGRSVVALFEGLFQLAAGSRYDSSPSAQTALGIPPCYACHQVRPPASAEFTLYITVLDVLGPCRELFSNTFMDTLEALQLASFQGPQVVLVEPFICNAVWQRYGELEAAELHAKAAAEGRKWSIYSNWNSKTACGLRHGSVTPFGVLFDWPALSSWLREVRGIRGQISWEEFLQRTGSTLDVLAMQADHPNEGQKLHCGDSDQPMQLRFYQSDLNIQRRVCVRDTKHTSGFELRLLDDDRFAETVQTAVAKAKSSGKTWASVGLYFYWIEGAERARLHPGRHGYMSVHSYYTSIWRGLRFSQWVFQRAGEVARKLKLRAGRSLGSFSGRLPYMAAHWRKGDWFLGPHPRKLEQAALAEVPKFASILREHLHRRGLTRLFLMTNAPANSKAVKDLARELAGTAELMLAPPLLGDENSLRQLCVEMALAAAADFFIAFGDGLIRGHVSMPSMLVLQMRLHAESWPLQSHAFSFASPGRFGEDWLGL
ncbi:unnamed protein product [Symbiodinium natans]|uniref:Uncharacterized protein n=1 Tax=Symbiodinium natans TaxID=878477 RepID=A0A812QQY4_9DINO|nr:unnamed protein product [Symbiodinium natans]